jgi:hypothetical protein
MRTAVKEKRYGIAAAMECTGCSGSGMGGCLRREAAGKASRM